jgi:hypothetical protein
MPKEYWFRVLLVGSLAGPLIGGATEWSYSGRTENRLAQATTPRDERSQPATPGEGKSRATTARPERSPEG